MFKLKVARALLRSTPTPLIYSESVPVFRPRRWFSVEPIAADDRTFDR